MTDITHLAAEGYLDAVAEALTASGHPNEHAYDGAGGSITVAAARPDAEPLRLHWTADEGWSAGYAATRHGPDCLVELWLDAVPPPWRVVLAVRAIVEAGDLSAGVAEDNVTHGAEELITYAPPLVPLVQAAAAGLRDRARRLRGQPPVTDPVPDDSWTMGVVRPIVAAIGRALQESGEIPAGASRRVRARRAEDAARTVRARHPQWAAEEPALRVLLDEVPRMAAAIRKAAPRG